MTVHFYDDAHEAFFREKLERAAQEMIRSLNSAG